MIKTNLSTKLKIAGLVASVLLVFGAGYKVAAWKYGEKIASIELNYARATLEVQAANQKLEKQRQENIDRANQINELKNQLRNKKEKTIIKKVTKYVETANSCLLYTSDAADE